MARGLATMPSIGLILTTYDFLEMTKRCLSSLERSATVPVDLVVVDNCSTDGTPEHLRSRGYAVITNPDRVYLATALNQGLRHFLSAGASYVGWVHNDMLFYKGWLEPLVRVLAVEESAGKISPYNWQGDPDLCDDAKASQFMRANAGNIYPGNGCPWLMRRDTVEEIGMFDEGYVDCGGYEDWDYNNRILEAGQHVLITGGSVVWHQSMGTRRHTEQGKAARVNAARYCAKWGPAARV